MSTTREVLKALEPGEGAGEDYLKRAPAGEDPSAEDLEAAEDLAAVVGGESGPARRSAHDSRRPSRRVADRARRVIPPRGGSS